MSPDRRAQGDQAHSLRQGPDPTRQPASLAIPALPSRPPSQPIAAYLMRDEDPTTLHALQPDRLPQKIHTVLTDNGTHFTTPGNVCPSTAGIRIAIDADEIFRAHLLEYICAQNQIDHRLTKPRHLWTNSNTRTHEPDPQGCHRQTIPRRVSRLAQQLSGRLRHRQQLRPSPEDPKVLTPYEFICKTWIYEPHFSG